MFGRKQIIITISKNHLLIDEVNKARIANLLSTDWEKGELDAILKKKRKLIGKRKVRLLIADDFCYVLGLKFQKGDRISRELVQERAIDSVPEDLDKTKWDYAIVAQKADEIFVQIFALTIELSKTVDFLLEELNLEIEAIEPCSLILNSELAKKSGTHAVVHYDKVCPLAFVSQQGTVLFSKKVSSPKSITQVIKFAKEQYQLELDKVFLSGLKKEVLAKEKLAVKTTTLNPRIHFAHKADLDGKDEKTLNIILKETQRINKKTLFILLVIILLIALVAGIVIFSFIGK